MGQPGSFGRPKRRPGWFSLVDSIAAATNQSAESRMCITSRHVGGSAALISGEACLRHDFRSRHERGSCAPAERVKGSCAALAVAPLTHSDAGAVGLREAAEASVGRGGRTIRGPCEERSPTDGVDRTLGLALGLARRNLAVSAKSLRGPVGSGHSSRPASSAFPCVGCGLVVPAMPRQPLRRRPSDSEAGARERPPLCWPSELYALSTAARPSLGREYSIEEGRRRSGTRRRGTPEKSSQFKPITSLGGWGLFVSPVKSSPPFYWTDAF